MSEHAPLAASDAPIWGHCAGSIRARQGMPNLETEDTRIGTAVHWVGSSTLEGRRAGAPLVCAQFVGAAAPNGVVITAEMAEGAQLYVDDVAEVCDRHQCWDKLLIEQRVHMPAIHPTDNWGTLDAAVMTHEALFVWDYKNGHRSVMPEGNLQLADYVNGLCELMGIDGYWQQSIKLEMRVVQPFCYDGRGSVRSWSGVVADLRGAWNQLALQAEEALGPAPTLTTGDHCLDCRAVGKCAAARKAGCNTVHLVRQPYQMDTMTGNEMALELELLESASKLLKGRITALEDELMNRVRGGEQGIGLGLKSTQGREMWLIPPAAAVLFAQQFGVDASAPACKTPRQTREAAPTEVRELLTQAMASVVDRKPGSLKLVPVEDTLAHRCFQPKRT